MSDPNAGAGPGRGLLVAFLVGDALLLTVAWLVFRQAHRPMLPYEALTIAGATAIGAWLGVWPFVLRHRAAEAWADRAQLAGTLAQLQRLEDVAERIGLATSQWQIVQEQAAGAVESARQIADRLSEEQRQVRRVVEQGQSAQLQHLELEVNKLRRAEGDWLQTLVRILDHVYALYSAAARSAQSQLAEQIGAFQNACRDAARRVGLVPLVIPPGTPFDPQAHQLLDPQATLPEQPVVAVVAGTGYSFQGQLLRRVVVTVQPGAHYAAVQPAVSGDAVALSSGRVPPASGSEPAGGESDGEVRPHSFVLGETPSVSGTGGGAGRLSGGGGELG
jgi:molecular chaperone GrpE (heat shock protein)